MSRESTSVSSCSSDSSDSTSSGAVSSASLSESGDMSPLSTSGRKGFSPGPEVTLRGQMRQPNDKAWPFKFAFRTVTPSVIPALREFFDIPLGLDILPPASNSKFDTVPPAGYVSFNVTYLDFGVHLPLDPFYISLLQSTRMSPGQITPNSWACIVGFVVLCRVVLHIEPDLAGYACVKHLTCVKRKDGIETFNGSHSLQNSRRPSSSTETLLSPPAGKHTPRLI